MSELIIHHLSGGYGAATALFDVELMVPRGSTTAIIGANGAGKTSLLRAVGGLLGWMAGEVRVGGVDVAGMAAHRIARLGVCHVPQGRGTFVDLSVDDNLAIGAWSVTGRSTLDRGARATRQQMYELFPVLAERRNQTAGELSGGEQQMLAIARAMMGRPKVLLLDEPSVGLAPAIATEVFSSLHHLDADVTTVLVEQDIRSALDLADRAYVMAVGRIVRGGTAQEIRDDPTVGAAYLGIDRR